MKNLVAVLMLVGLGWSQVMHSDHGERQVNLTADITNGGPLVADCPHAKFLTYDVAKHKFSCPVTRFVNTPSKTKAVLKDMQIGAVSHMETPMPAMLASAPAPPDGAYNFILPAKIPGNGIYKCRVRSRVLEFVDLPKESK